MIWTTSGGKSLGGAESKHKPTDKENNLGVRPASRSAQLMQLERSLLHSMMMESFENRLMCKFAPARQGALELRQHARIPAVAIGQLRDARISAPYPN